MEHESTVVTFHDTSAARPQPGSQAADLNTSRPFDYGQEGALQTVAGYEAMHAIRKGQIRWLPKGDIVGQVQFIQRILGIAA